MWPALTVGACAIAALLGWEALHGGIRAHHLLADPSMPAISNAWGLLTVPGLAWLAAYTVARRAREVPDTVRAALLAWAGALLVGAALAAAFMAGVSALSNAIALGALAAGLVVRTYRAEIGYGFTLGMMAAVGPVLPLLVVAVAAVLSALAHLLVWPGVAWLWRKAQR
jgi:hypothetical protein